MYDEEEMEEEEDNDDIAGDAMIKVIIFCKLKVKY